RGLGDEGERAVLIDRDLHGDDGPHLLGGPLVERLAELHDVDAVLTEGRPHRRRRIRLARGHLQLDDRYDFASHAYPAARLLGSFLLLGEDELHRSIATEHGHDDPQPAPLRVHLFHPPGEISERTGYDPHGVAATVRNPRLRLLI